MSSCQGIQSQVHCADSPRTRLSCRQMTNCEHEHKDHRSKCSHKSIGMHEMPRLFCVDGLESFLNGHRGLSDARYDSLLPSKQWRYLCGNSNFEHRRLGFTPRLDRGLFDLIEIVQALGSTPVPFCD